MFARRDEENGNMKKESAASKNTGIIYIMTTAVPGLIKIGKTGPDNFERRMYNLEHDGYRNVTALRREFAIKVDNYDEKEKLLHTIFEKSQLADTELFAVDVNQVVQLLSSFDGEMVYPKTEGKSEVFVEAADATTSKLNPDGTYNSVRKKKAGGAVINAKATVKNGCWTILRGSVLSMVESIGGSKKAKEKRAAMEIAPDGRLLEDAELGECSPSFAGNVVINGACDGWEEWKNKKGERITIYRKKKVADEE